MNPSKQFPPVLLDDVIGLSSEGQHQPCEHAQAGRIWNVFDRGDLDKLSIHPNEKNPVLRIYDLSLIDALAAHQLDHLPVIISHLIDLKGGSLPEHNAGIAIEVANRADLEAANRLSCSLLIGRSFEAPGPSKESSAFIIYQLLKSESCHPFYIHGATGFALFQTYLALGVSGIVLSADQFSSGARDKTVRFSLGGNNIVRLAFAGGTPEAIAYRQQQQKEPGSFLKTSFEQGYWASEKSDLWDHKWRDKTLEYLKLYNLSPREIVNQSCFPEASPAALKVGSRYPFFQGAMANITQYPDFAEAVAKEGALPCLALAGLSVQRSVEIVTETAGRGFPFAVNFVALSLSSEDLESLIGLFEETRPAYVVISAPQLDHVNRLLKTDLEVAVHAPNRAMFKVLFDMGCRNFIIEGEEAGGHTSNVGGLSAWQGVLEEIRDRNLQDKVHLIFAGGIYDRRAADLLSGLLYFYGLEKDLMVSLQLGTAYLSTVEAVEFTGLPDAYRQTIISGEDTVITGESVHRNVRQMVTTHSTDLLEKEWSIFSSELELGEKKKAYERLYRGGLKLAVGSEQFEEDGSYMAGAVSTLLLEVMTIEQLHEGLVQEPSIEQERTFEPIAIVGIGSILPGSNNVTEHFNNILLKRCFITDTPDSIWERSVYLEPGSDESDTSYSGIAGLPEEVDSDLTAFRIPPSVSDEMSQLQIVTLKCAQQALQDAGYYKRPFPKNRVGAVIGAAKVASVDLYDKLVWRKIRARLDDLIKEGSYDAESVKSLIDDYEEEFNQFEITADTILGGNPSLAVSRLASVFDFQGLTNAIDAACSSSLAAIGNAITLLQERRCDVVISGGVGTGTGAEEFIGFSRIQALSSKGSFPFDERADGFVIGAGGTLFVLKRYEDAIRNGDEIYALIRGWGAANDGTGKGIAAPDFEGQTRCLNDAYVNSGIDPLDVDFLECHATGTPVGDAEERKTVAEFFGKDRLQKKLSPLVLGGSKAITGHVRSGAGAVGMLSGIFAINQRCVPPQVNFEQAPEGVCLEDLGLHVAKRPEAIVNEEIISGISSFGFGGINYHAVLSSSPRNQRKALVDVERANYLSFPELTSDVAYVFPGQGAQFAGMLHEFKDCPEVAHLLKKADEIYQEISGSLLSPILLELPSVDVETEKEQMDSLLSTEVSQPAIFLSSVVMLEWIRQQGGARPGLVLGHSLGEYAALYAAGILGFEDAFTLVCLRGQLMSAARSAEAGAMIAIEAGERVAQSLIDQVDGYATCANLNEYRQTVISGEQSAIDAIEKIARQAGMKAFPLNVSRAFHSKLVGDCVEPIRKQLESIDFKQSETPVLACLSRESFPVGGESGASMGQDDRLRVISLLSRQIDHPVDFISQINAAYENGIRRFVEVGSKGTLTRLIDQILENKPFQTVFLNQVDTDTLQQIEQLPGKLKQAVEIKRQPAPVSSKDRRPSKKKAVAEPAEKKMSLIDQVFETVSSISGYELAAIDKDAEFERDLGIDTLKIFEILSRLRGDILPQEIENFRELTSVQKILMVAESYSSSTEEKTAGTGSSIGWYKHKMVQTATLSAKTPLMTGGDFGIDRLELPYSGDKHQLVLMRPLLSSMRSAGEELLPELHQKIVFLAGLPDGQRPSHVHVMTYCPADRFYDGAFFALEAMLKVAQLDVPGIRFSYAHFDGDCISEEEMRRILSRVEDLPDTGKHVRKDGSITQGRLFPLNGLFGSEDRLPDLLTTDDLVLITGGARGIAAGIARHLIEVTTARFILVGRKQETESWIQALPDDRVSYRVADLTDPESIQALALHKERVSLLIHAAGIEVPANLVKKSAKEFALTMATKVLSLDDILSKLDTDNLRGVVQFSSIAAYRGNYGQADYAAANALLNGTLEGGIPALSIAWPAWSEVGMASRGVIKEILETSGAAFISPQEGREVFEKLLTGLLLSPPRGTTRFVASGKLAGPYMTSYQGEDRFDGANSIAPYRLSDPDQKISTAFKLDLDRVPALREHHFYGTIYIPAAVMLREIVRLVIDEQREAGDLVEFSSIEFLSPISVAGDTQQQLHFSRQNDFVLLEMEEDGGSRPIVSLKLGVGKKAACFREDDLDLLAAMRSSSELRATPFSIHRLNLKNSEESSFRGAFATLDELQYNGYIVTSNVDMSLAAQQGMILSDTGRVPLLLEAAFQTASRWKQFGINTRHLFMPKQVGRCTIDYQACAQAREAKVYCQFVKTDEVNKARTLNIIVVNENEEALIILKGFVTSPTSIREPLCIHTIPQGVPLLIHHSDLLTLSLPQAYQYAEDNRNSIITEKEGVEIVALSSDKRRKEKFAGKLATKLLAQHLLAKEGQPQQVPLDSIEVFSEGSPVSVDFHAAQLEGDSFFSISHSEDLVCVARNKQPVGVDVEKIRALPAKVVTDCCGAKLEEEIRAYITDGNFCEQDRDFLKQALPILIFTQKEAVLKAAGIGIGEGLSDVRIEGIHVQLPFIATFRGLSYEVTSTHDRQYVISVANLAEEDSVREETSREIEVIKQVPLSFLQQDCLRRDGLLRPDEKFSYTLDLRIQFEGEFYADVLQQALDVVFGRHEVLRMVFKKQEDHYVGCILKLPEVSLERVEVSDEVSLTESMRRHARVKFDLEKGPLFKATLFCLGENHKQVQLVIDHNIMDCFCALILAREITGVYQELALGNEVARGAPSSYEDFVRRESARNTPQRVASLQRYWSRTFRGLDADQLALPAVAGITDSEKRSAEPRGHFIKQKLDSDLAKGLDQTCRQTGVTLFAGLLAAVQSALMKDSGKGQGLVHIPFSNRDRVLDGGATGNYICLLPIRAEIGKDEVYQDLMKAQRATLFDAIGHGDIAPAELAALLRKETQLSCSPPAVICQLIQEENDPEQDQGQEFIYSVIDGMNPYTSLVLSFYADPGGIRCVTTFNPDLVDENTVEGILQRCWVELQRMVADPLQAVAAPTVLEIGEGGFEAEKLKGGESSLLSQTESKASIEVNREQVVDQVLVIWQYVLKGDYLMKADADFFELGGTSLQAVEIVTQVKEVFGLDLPLASFVEASTPALQAELILSREWEGGWQAAVALKASGNKAAFFCVHPSDGNVLCYAELASAMGEDRPFYGLQAKGLKGDEAPLREVEEMASYYIAAMREVQTEGLYHIGGWSAGGVIAFEMAQQLRAMGEEVNLIVIDAIFPQQAGDQQVDSGTTGTLGQEAEAARQRQVLLGDDPSPVPESYPQGQTLRAIWDTASARYQPKIYPGRITLVTSESYEQRKQFFISRLKLQIKRGNLVRAARVLSFLEMVESQGPSTWQQVAGNGLEILPTSGDHHSLLYEENCRDLARHLMRCMDVAEMS
ncbi:MAG: SDR family NAD(P)-dependent oxidoreductase [Verrucomicrobiota bacterium]